MIVLTVILQVLVFLVLDVVAHIISWNLQKKVRMSLWKSIFVTAVVLVILFHAVMNPWVWVCVTAICVGATHGILEARSQDPALHLWRE